MKKDERNVSRRNFLSTGLSAAAVSSILVIENSAATPPVNTEKSIAALPQMPLSGDPVTTTDVQTLINKTIPSISNILGTDHVNVREYPIAGTDITDALNAAINSLANGSSAPGIPKGGRILIPRGRWTSRGGHKIYASISIEGSGTQIDPDYYGVPWGTEIQLVPGETQRGVQHMFRIEALHHNCSLKDMSITLGGLPAIGLLMTDGDTSQSHVKLTSVQNVTFSGGNYGIKVESTSNFECILNHFERICFHGCKTSFFCNTVNSGFLLDTCYFFVPENGIALELEVIGGISMEHCLFVNHGASAPNSTILKTVGAFNSISFYDCQDEGIPTAYRNTGNAYDYVPIVYRNCLIQSKFRFTAPGSIVLDSCRVNVEVNQPAIYDTPTVPVKVFLKGQYNFFAYTSPIPTYYGYPFQKFVNPNSQVIYESLEIGEPAIFPGTAPVPAYYVINKTRGLIYIDAGGVYASIFNTLVTENSLVFAQLQSYDSGGVKIREVICESGRIQINLTGPATAKLRIAFKVEG